MAFGQTAYASVGKIYGATSISSYSQTPRVPSFAYSDGSWDFTTIAPICADDPDVLMPCGANCNGTYYGLLVKEGVAQKLVNVDWNTGTTTDVATLSADYPVFIDMAYNFATEKLYGGTKTDDGKTDIYEVSLTDGSAVKVATLDIAALAFDFSFDGKFYAFFSKEYNGSYGLLPCIYGISYDADFKPLGEENRIYSQWSDCVPISGDDPVMSVEFDHIDNLIYYSSCGSSQQYTYTIDPATWMRGEGFMLGNDYPDMVSLYIPFTAPEGGANSASTVTDLKATTDATGALRDTLTWTNPTTTFANGELEELYSVRVYRNSISDENLAVEITEGVKPGAAMMWIDENAVQGENKYVVVPCRVKDEKGLDTEVSVWVGFDIPGRVNNVNIEAVDGGISVSWDKPMYTVNNGVLDESTLKYTVVREPDKVVVAEDITETSVLDTNPLPEWQNYSYMITAKTDAGEGEAFDGWQNIFAGPDLTAPYEYAFDDYDAFQMWTQIGDGVGTGYVNGNAYVLMLPDWAKDEHGRRDIYLISPSINLEKGKYDISVGSYISMNTGATNSFEVLYGSGKTVEDMTNKIGETSYTAPNDATEAIAEDLSKMTVDIPESGSYNFAIHITSELGDFNYPDVCFNLFKIEEASVSKFNVTGCVATTYGEVVEGAKVTISGGEETVETTSAADGTFKVEVSGTNGEYGITVEKSGYEKYTGSFEFTGKDVALGDILLTTTSGISGIVYDADGKADVKVYDMSGRLVKVAKATKGAKLNLGLSKGIYIINGKKVVVE